MACNISLIRSTCTLASILVGASSVGAQCPSFDGQFGPGNGLQIGQSGARALIVHDDGSGTALYVGGSFTFAGTNVAENIARWDGTAWSSLGNGILGSFSEPVVDALAVYDDGSASGAALYAGGHFFSAGGNPATNVAKWDGANWSPLGTGFGGASSTVYAMTVFDDGSGPALYVAGAIQAVNFTWVPTVKKWNGTSWSTLAPIFVGELIFALAVFDDGSGPALYAGGCFQTIGGVTARSLAKWNGVAWSEVGGGVDGFGDTCGGVVRALTVFDDGNGPALYVGGTFQSAGGNDIGPTARWNGSSWSPYSVIGQGGDVFAVGAFDDGTGSGARLYSASSGGAVAPGALGGPAFALTTFTDPNTNRVALYMAGAMTTAGGQPSLGIAELHGCDMTGLFYCFGDGSSAACPCGNASIPGQRAGCTNSAGSGAALRASGTPSVSADSLVLAGSRMTSTSSCLYFQGTAQPNGGHGTAFGDGLRCVGGSVIRLGVEHNANGASRYPSVGDPSVSVKGMVSSGATRDYQVWYRDAASFCTPSTFNLTNGVRVTWSP